jgi:hypothetical protein
VTNGTVEYGTSLSFLSSRDLSSREKENHVPSSPIRRILRRAFHPAPARPHAPNWAKSNNLVRKWTKTSAPKPSPPKSTSSWPPRIPLPVRSCRRRPPSQYRRDLAAGLAGSKDVTLYSRCAENKVDATGGRQRHGLPRRPCTA